LGSWLVVARRRIQSWLISAVRRSPLFPKTVANRLGDDDSMEGQRLDEAVLVYFPGALDSLYQILPWLGPFNALHRTHRVVIVCQDSRVAAELRRRSTQLRVITIARYGRLDDLLSRSDVKLALYVSHTARNFECLRFTSLIHVYLGHGDSDKGVSASNQLKAYDYAMVPGQAAVDRIATRLIHYDVTDRCILIGQPQFVPETTATREADDRCSVLYAPTWEGAQPSVAYSSLASHGPRLVKQLLADPRFRVIFRPHPLSGVTSGEYSAANKEVSDAIREVLRANPGSGHRDVRANDEPLETTFADADLLVCDISAVATAWLVTGRPLLVTVPAAPQAEPADSGLIAAVPRLSVAELPDVAELLWTEFREDTAAATRKRLAEYYFADTGEGPSPDRFIAECTRLIQVRDTARLKLLEMGGGGI
jgi:hypothetical protein